MVIEILIINASLVGHPLEVGERDSASIVVVEELERLQYLLLGVFLGHL